jgi:GlpG protein
MSPVAVLRLPLQTDLSGFVELLRRLNVPHRVSEEAGQQVLWVPDAPQLADDIRQLYQQYPEGDRQAAKSWPSAGRVRCCRCAVAR